MLHIHVATFKVWHQRHYNDHSKLLVFSMSSCNALSESLGKFVLDVVIGQGRYEELVL